MAAPSPFPTGPVIYTPRLILRPMSLTDLDSMHRIWSMPEMRQYLAPEAKTLEQTRAWLAPRAAPPAFNFAVHLRTPDGGPGAFVGAMGSTRGPPEVGYGVDAAYFGRGLVTEALGAFETAYWAFVPPGGGAAPAAEGAWDGGGPQPARLDDMATALRGHAGCDVLEAYTNAENVGSRRVLEKCGFTLIEQGPGRAPVGGKTVYDCRYAKPRPGRTLADAGVVVRV